MSDDDLGVASGALNTMAVVGTSMGVTLFTAALGDASTGSSFLVIYLGTAAAAGLAFAAGTQLPSGGRSRLRAGTPSTPRL